MKVDWHLLVNENGSSQLGPLLRVVAMVMANDYSARMCVLDMLQNICA